MKIKSVFLAAILAAVLCISGNLSAACPSADLTGDCIVNLADLAKMAEQWLTGGTPTPVLYGMTWVSINDSGAGMKDEYGNPISHGGFTGEISKYETTNAQYCEFLNAAKASGDITVSGSYVVGAGGPYSGQNYYDLAGLGVTANGAIDGGAARINWTGGSFTVDSGFENHPVSYVSWYGAAAFAGYYGWRLPTEWEWQAVADFNGTYTYGHGPGTITNSLANYYNSTHPHGTTAVGTYAMMHGYGMCDMAGNVWEWMSTAIGSVYASRGGGWVDDDSYCSASYRLFGSPVNTSSDLGFRVCR